MCRVVPALIVLVAVASGCVPWENHVPERTGVEVHNRTDLTLTVEFEAVPYDRVQGQPLRVDRSQVDDLGDLKSGAKAIFEPSAVDERGTMADMVVRTAGGDEVVRLARGLTWEGALTVEVTPDQLP